MAQSKDKKNSEEQCPVFGYSLFFTPKFTQEYLMASKTCVVCKLPGSPSTYFKRREISFGVLVNDLGLDFFPSSSATPAFDQGFDETQRDPCTPLQIVLEPSAGNVEEHDGSGAGRVTSPILDQGGVVDEIA